MLARCLYGSITSFCLAPISSWNKLQRVVPIQNKDGIFKVEPFDSVETERYHLLRTVTTNNWSNIIVEFRNPKQKLGSKQRNISSSRKFP